MITIVELIPEDLSLAELLELTKIFNRAKASTTGFSNVASLPKDLSEEIKGEKILAAKSNNRIVGFLAIWEADSFIHHLFVLPKFQGQGIGEMLLSYCEKKYGRPLELKCLQDNKRACTFYERNGWRAISVMQGPEGAHILYRLDI